MSIGDVAALVGATTGPAGLLISLLVYFRDRPVVTVSLQWDMEMLGPSVDRAKSYFVVTIRNVGRRPIYLSHAHVHVPRRAELFLADGLQGVTFAEGCPPHVVCTDQAAVEKHADMWWKLRATVIDAAGKHYHSDWPTKAPSWAKAVKPTLGAIAWNRLRNSARRRLP